MSQMAVPEEHTTKVVPPAPSAFSVASTGAAAFQSWLEEEEEEWRLGRMLEAKCPKEFTCPISLDIMADPVILVRLQLQHLIAICLHAHPCASLASAELHRPMRESEDRAVSAARRCAV